MEEAKHRISQLNELLKVKQRRVNNLVTMKIL